MALGHFDSSLGELHSFCAFNLYMHNPPFIRNDMLVYALRVFAFGFWGVVSEQDRLGINGSMAFDDTVPLPFFITHY